MEVVAVRKNNVHGKLGRGFHYLDLRTSIMPRRLRPEGDMALPHADQIRSLRHDLDQCQKATSLLPQIEGALCVLEADGDWDTEHLMQDLSSDFPRSNEESDVAYLGRIRTALRPIASKRSAVQNDFEQLAKSQWEQLQAPEWSADREWILDLKGKQEVLLQGILPGQERTGRLLPALSVIGEQLSTARTELLGNAVAQYRSLARMTTSVEVLNSAWEEQSQSGRPPAMPPLPANPSQNSLTEQGLQSALDSLQHWCEEQGAELLKLKTKTDALRDEMHQLENELRQRTG